MNSTVLELHFANTDRSQRRSSPIVRLLEVVVENTAGRDGGKKIEDKYRKGRNRNITFFADYVIV